MLKTTGPSGGRPKAPVEKRRARSKNPHKNRQGPPDVPMTQVFDMTAIPAEPPVHLCERGLECWRMITEQQRGPMGARWIYRSDSAYLVATCQMFARWAEVRDRLDAHRADGEDIYDAESNRVNALYALEASLLAQYQRSLVALGLVPTRRQVTLESEPTAKPDGLLAH